MARTTFVAKQSAKSAFAGSRSVTLPYAAFLGLVALTVGSAVGMVSVVGYLHLRDEAPVALGARQQSVDRSYELRINELRRELDKVNSMRLVEEAATSARVRELSSRQSELEARSVTLAALAQSSGMLGAPQGAVPANRTQNPTPLATTGPAAPAGAPAPLGFAPQGQRPAADAVRALERAASPQPKGSPSDVPPPELRPGLRGASLFNSSPEEDGGRGANHPNARRVAEIEERVAHLDRLQVEAVQAIGLRARQQAARLQAAFAEIGLRPERLAPQAPAAGGPFVPLPPAAAASEFGRKLASFDQDVRRVEQLRRALTHVPVGRPVSPTAEMSSNFGSRIDPFLGRPAFHTGVDFRDWYGAPVFAAASGSVASAGHNGGYGLMVEIEHGGGLATRYAHLSSIHVKESQTVTAGQRIGRIGSTGRSTGPHLHYEVRIDDEAVDPTRFLRAGARLSESSAGQECLICAGPGLP